MRNRYLYVTTLLSLLGFSAEAMAQALTQTPRLVVSIAVEQLRTDYLENYAPLYSTEGLRKMLAEGIVFPNASYNFTPVDRTSAIASLVTGSIPYYNNITGTEWLDRNTLRPCHTLSDNDYGYSPQQLGTSTLADELKIATNGTAKVFAFATSAECAILSAGHTADGAAWLEQQAWETARYYTPANPWLDRYVRLYPPLSTSNDINGNITRIALKCVEQSDIGNDDDTDLLGITYVARPDVDGYLALDINIAELVKGITARIPLDRVLFVLTSTGSSEEVEKEDTNERFRIPTGKFYINRTANLLNMYLGAVYGTGQYVESCYRNQLFLNHLLISKKNINTGDMLRQAQEFLLQISGVRNVYTSNQLMTSDSQLLLRIRNGFNVEKCGDLLIDIQPGWQLVNEDTHTSSVSRTSNIPFPIIFFGANVKAERVKTPVTVDRIAPTIARAIRIRAPNACSAEPLF